MKKAKKAKAVCPTCAGTGKRFRGCTDPFCDCPAGKHGEEPCWCALGLPSEGREDT